MIKENDDRTRELNTIRLWAAGVMDDPEAVILDSETTGLGDNAQIVQLSIINVAGDVLFDSLLKPTVPVETGAMQVHGITDEMLADAPTIADMSEDIQQVLDSASRVIIYNRDYDVRLLRQSFAAHGLILKTYTEFQCAMEPYSTYVGDWNDHHGNYRWQRLPGGDHSALGDCRATLDIIKEMARA